MSEQPKSKVKTFENSFASLLFPEDSQVPQKSTTKKKRVIESNNKIQPPNPPQSLQKPNSQLKTQSQCQSSTSNQLIIHKLVTKAKEPKNNSENAPKTKQEPSLNIKKSVNKNNNNKPFVQSEIPKKAKIDNNDPMLNKLKNFNNLDDLVNSLEQGKEDFKKYFSSSRKNTKNSSNEKRKLKSDEKNNIPLTHRKNVPLHSHNQSTDTNIKNNDFLNKKRNPSTSLVQQSKPPVIPKKPFNFQPKKDIDFKKLINNQKEKAKQEPPKKEHKKADKPLLLKETQPPTKQTNQKIEAKLNQLANLMKGNSKVSTQKKVSKKNGMFSKEDFDDNDSFIVDDEDEEDPYQYRKHLAKINHKLMRGRQLFEDDGDLEEANFDTIQREEKITADIGEYEDQLEEMKELERLKRKSNKIY